MGFGVFICAYFLLIFCVVFVFVFCNVVNIVWFIVLFIECEIDVNGVRVIDIIIDYVVLGVLL